MIFFSQIITCGGLADSFTNVLKALVQENKGSSLESTNKLHFVSGKKKDLSMLQKILIFFN